METRHHLLENPAETRLLAHMPQLDGVRAIAVLLVLWHHFQPRSLAIGGGAPWGAIGVGMFFTLSGFLITRILLRCRLKIDAGEAGVGGMMKQFYMRRFLRIFPLFYGTIILLAVFNPTNARERVWWHFTYLSNVRFSYWRKEGEIERHFWSLSVEEQFYLIWPLLILLVPRKLLLPLILLTIVVAPIWSATTYTPGLLIHEWMMPACLGLLGGGALLALASLPEFKVGRLWTPLVETAGVIGVPLFFIYVTAHSIAFRSRPGTTETTSFFGVVGQTPVGRSGWLDLGFDWIALGGAVYPVTAIFAVFLVGSAARGFRGPMGDLLRCPPMVYIGRISYGLYVIHMFVPHVVVHYYPAWAGVREWPQFFAYTGISLVVATISWYAFEAPINRLKRFFEYDQAKHGA